MKLRGMSFFGGCLCSGLRYRITGAPVESGMPPTYVSQRIANGKQMQPIWLSWARELQAIAQTGLTFAKNRYDRQRYEAIRSLAARILAEHTEAEPDRIEALFAQQAGYATPKVDTRGAVFRDDGSILLVRENADAGRWTLPGGWADVNEAPSECVVREVREESGFEVVTRKLAAVYDRDRHGHVPPHAFHVYKLFFICDISGGAPCPGPETSEVAFFTIDNLPEDLSAARVQRHQIERMFEHWRSPHLPTEFD
jgi:ADP-ribose pyrophosphatase YjhB (NUDIX family)